MSFNKRIPRFWKFFCFDEETPEEILDETDVHSYFNHYIFDITQSQHRIVRVSKGSNKKYFAIILFQFCSKKTLQRYILRKKWLFPKENPVLWSTFCAILSTLPLQKPILRCKQVWKYWEQLQRVVHSPLIVGMTKALWNLLGSCIVQKQCVPINFASPKRHSNLLQEATTNVLHARLRVSCAIFLLKYKQLRFSWSSVKGLIFLKRRKNKFKMFL